ncbi:hypothetical protein D3C76_1051510 [compost metagenome]
MRIGTGLQQFVTGGRAAQVDRRIAVDASVVGRALDELPVTILALHLDHRHTFAGQGLVHFLRRLRHARMGVEVAVVGVFVVDRHQRPVVVIGEGEQAHAVVVVTELDFLMLGGAVATRVEGRAVFLQGLTPTDQYRRLVAGWQGDRVAGRGGNAFETQQPAGAGADTGGQYAATEQVATEKHGGTAQGAGADESTAAEADHLFEVGGLVVF